jgi:ubiquinone/menaquinone biosynthesis C-methylase UbiE
MSRLNTKRSHYFTADNTERREWQNPEAILVNIGLKKALIFIDVGCGGGFFSMPAARITGKSGKVYGIDSNHDYIDELRAQATKENLSNIHLTVGKAEETVVCEGCADIIFFGVVMHDFEDASKVLINANKMLKPNGRLINLDWKKERADIGPQFQKRFSENYAADLIETAGFTIEYKKPSGRHHYLISAKKNIKR